MPKEGAGKTGTRPDLATLGGMLLAVGGILGGLLLEGGGIQDIAQPTAALIVLGGTLGAVMITTPLHTFIAACRRLRVVFFERSSAPDDYIAEILGYATRARKSGIASLEVDLDEVQNPFLYKALSLGVDGTDIKDLKQIMQIQIDMEEQFGLREARVFEAAGGYAPTVGIIGAVLGLIQVMKNLENIEEVGHGIAVAFVATVYGVGLANLFFLPVATKIRARIAENSVASELILEGVCSIVEGLNPKMIERKLESFVQARTVRPARSSAKAGSTSAAA